MTELLLVALAVFAFALVSERLSMAPVTGPMVFTLVGLVVGQEGFGWFDVALDSESVSILVEATLVLVLFTDAVRIDLRALRREYFIPVRLLGIGLPLTVLAGAVVAAVVFPAFTFAEAALLAAVLAPTDAALGQAVVSDMALPVRLRQGLNVESGLNDGIMVPVVTVTLAIAASEFDGFNPWGAFVARQIGFGLLFGIGIGVLGALVLRHQVVAGRVEGVYRQLGAIAIAVAAFAAAEMVGGNGFMAAFTAGLAFGSVARDQCEGIGDFTEDEGTLLSAITFLIFGAAFAGVTFEAISWPIVGYAVLSLTVIRMGPVLLSLIRSGTRAETRLFIGWFGPRGLASILFALLVVDELDSPHVDTIFAAATTTVFLSILAHGLTASPWAGRLSRVLSSGPADQVEMGPAPEMATRRGMPGEGANRRSGR